MIAASDSCAWIALQQGKLERATISEGMVKAGSPVAMSRLENLVMMYLNSGGIMSKNRRWQYQYTVTEDVFDFIEQAQALLKTNTL